MVLCTHLLKDCDSAPAELYKDYDSVPTGCVGFGTAALINCTQQTCLTADREGLHIQS